LQSAIDLGCAFDSKAACATAACGSGITAVPVCRIGRLAARAACACVTAGTTRAALGASPACHPLTAQTARTAKATGPRRAINRRPADPARTAAAASTAVYQIYEFVGL
jgi:hypothetical protein